MVRYVINGKECLLESFGDYRILRPVNGEERGRPFAILGAFNPNEHSLEPVGNSLTKVTTAIKYDGVHYWIDALPNVLDRDVKVGSRIVLRYLDDLLQPSNKFTITGPVSEIRG